MRRSLTPIHTALPADCSHLLASYPATRYLAARRLATSRLAASRLAPAALPICRHRPDPRLLLASSAHAVIALTLTFNPPAPPMPSSP